LSLYPEPGLGDLDGQVVWQSFRQRLQRGERLFRNVDVGADAVRPSRVERIPERGMAARRNPSASGDQLTEGPVDAPFVKLLRASLIKLQRKPQAAIDPPFMRGFLEPVRLGTDTLGSAR